MDLIKFRKQKKKAGAKFPAVIIIIIVYLSMVLSRAFFVIADAFHRFVKFL